MSGIGGDTATVRLKAKIDITSLTFGEALDLLREAPLRMHEATIDKSGRKIKLRRTASQKEGKPFHIIGGFAEKGLDLSKHGPVDRKTILLKGPDGEPVVATETATPK